MRAARRASGAASRQADEEDRQRIHKVEGVVGVRKRRPGPFTSNTPKEGSRGTSESARVKSDPWISAGGPATTGSPGRIHSRSRGSSPSTRAERARRLESTAPPPGRRRETSGLRNPGDHQPKSRGRQRELVVGRPAPPTHGPQRLVPAVGREQQSEPVQQREQTPFHSRGNLFARPLAQRPRATLSRWPRHPAPVRLRASTRAATPRIGSIDQVAVEERAASLPAGRSSARRSFRTRPGCPRWT